MLRSIVWSGSTATRYQVPLLAVVERGSRRGTPVVPQGVAPSTAHCAYLPSVHGRGGIIKWSTNAAHFGSTCTADGYRCGDRCGAATR